MHHFDPNLEPESRKAREQYIEHREKHLQTITMSAAETAIKFLFATNAGGAVAVLTYLGAVASNPNQQQVLKGSLVLFFLGVIFIGIYHILITETYASIFKRFQASTKNYFTEKKEWEAFLIEVQQQVKPSVIPRILVYSSFGSFIFGCAFGAASLFTWCV